MKAIYSSLNLVEVHHLKNLLQSAGIRCRIRNEDLVRLAGEVPFPECALQLVPEREEDTPAAEKLLAEAHVAVVPGEAFGTDRHVRISYATSMKELERGLERIHKLSRPQ